MRCYVIMGVAGCGKSSVGAELARRRGMRFVDADDLHPPANVAKMASGEPLTDADRAPWLRDVGQTFARAEAPVVIACSALKRSYRDIIRAQLPEPVAFIHLSAPPEVIGPRMQARADHFMPPALLQSQFATLEPLGANETGIEVPIDHPFEVVCDALAAYVTGVTSNA